MLNYIVLATVSDKQVRYVGIANLQKLGQQAVLPKKVLCSLTNARIIRAPWFI